MGTSGADGWLEQPFSLEKKRIWVAGYKGMVGSSVVRRLALEHCEVVKPTKRLDLREQEQVRGWMRESRPDVIVLAAAKVGGIEANRTRPAEFIYDNLMIEANIIKAAQEMSVQKLLFLGSSCIYPKEAPQPIIEEALLSGPLEPTNEAYALAKIAGIKLCQAMRAQYGCDFISAMPCNLYGPGDTYDEKSSHVIPALLMKANSAKAQGASEWRIWGSGTPLREFLHVDDLADALVFMLKFYSSAQPLNIGSGAEISIADLASMIARLTGLEASMVFDTSMPDGAARKLLDSTRLFDQGWSPKIELSEGLEALIRSLPIVR